MINMLLPTDACVKKTISTTRTFFLAMMLNPSVQKKAQEEIDRVVSADWLPKSEDRPNLPYVNAIVKETMRWNPPVPLGKTFEILSLFITSEPLVDFPFKGSHTHLRKMMYTKVTISQKVLLLYLISGKCCVPIDPSRFSHLPPPLQAIYT